ncbi:ATP-binding cassette domain-containing protein [Bosea sp. 117]|uniref:ABC transporter permease subunit n=1 Tax=Bosea sp. 117 TaxID=1125973 RepID=UPI0020C025FA|nr:ATP-binding cassette domain-containing protein [Bosea sp. 117]
MAIALVGAAVIGIGPYVLDSYSLSVLTRSLLYAAVALTVDLLWGYMGILTFGQSAFFAAGAYAAGLIFSHVGFSPATAPLALVGGVVVALVLAGIVGWLAFWHGATNLYASVITLVLPIVCTQLIFSGGNFTGSSSGLSGFESFDLSMEAWFWLSGSFLTAITAMAWLLVNSDAGRVLVAIRENEQRCQYLGIDTPRVKTLIFLLCAVIGAIAGYIFAGYAMVVSPELAGFVFGTELVIWTALGGRATLIGPVLGTLLVDYESAQLSGDYPFVWKLIIGSAFVLVIVAFPRGLLPLVSGAASRIGRHVLPGGTGERAVSVPRLLALPVSDAQGTEAGSGPALKVSGVRKSFGSLTVLDGIDFRAHAGELVSLVGPNGAGKTTLMRCIADGTERTSGEVVVNGHDLGRATPERCVALGVGRKFQTANVFDTLTVAECLRLARSRHERPSLWRRRDVLHLPEASLHVVRVTGLASRLGEEARLLSHGLKQALELAMVLALEPRVVLLDEPTAGLTKAERTQIGSILTDIVRTRGLCVLLVEHDLGFVREISSRVIVLHQGRILLDGSVDDVVSSELVASVYTGAVNLEHTA